MLEDAADQAAGRLQVDIALFMAVTVVDGLQVVAVKDPEGKIQFFSLINPLL